MKADMLHRIGTPSMERLGAAPNSVEMHQIADGYTERREVGRRILNLRQCPSCLRWGKLNDESCGNCSKRLTPETI